MATTLDNLDPKEAIEARLLAHLEGELPPAERADIEKYLQTNPQHRELLQSLARTRQDMQLLPRESAPAEIAEAFNTQLERSILLDNKSASGNMKLNRWPQVALVAAMLLLAASLATVVYLVLPSNKPANQVAAGGSSPVIPLMKDGPTTAPGSAVVDREPSNGSGGGGGPAAQGLATAGESVAARPGAPSASVKSAIAPDAVATDANSALKKQQALFASAVARANGSPSNAEQTPAVPGVVTDLTADNKVKEIQRAANSRDARKLYVVVNSRDPQAAALQLQTYFNRNEIGYEKVANASSLNVPNNGAANGNSNYGLSNVANAPGSQNQANAGAVLNDNSLNGYDQTKTQNQAPVNHALDLQAGKRDLASAGKPEAADNVYVAHGVTRLQVQELGLALNGQGQQTASISTTPPAAGAQLNDLKDAALLPIEKELSPATAPAPALIHEGDELVVTVDQLDKPGLDKTSRLRVADDGTVTLPMIEPVPARGLTPDDLQKRIAEKYHEAALIDNASVSVQVHEKGLSPAALAGALPTTAPTADLRQAGLPSTQPLTEDQEKVDAVVVLQSAPLTDGLQFNIPATQPAVAPTTTESTSATQPAGPTSQPVERLSR